MSDKIAIAAITGLMAFLWLVVYEAVQKMRASEYVLSVWEKCIIWPVASGVLLIAIGLTVLVVGMCYMYLTQKP